MKKTITAAMLCLASGVAVAGMNNCLDMYVGDVKIKRGGGLDFATFKDGPNDETKSGPVYFSDWTSEDKKSALALLIGAKVTSSRVNITIGPSSSCSIPADSSIYYAETVSLASKP